MFEREELSIDIGEGLVSMGNLAVMDTLSVRIEYNYETYTSLKTTCFLVVQM